MGALTNEAWWSTLPDEAWVDMYEGSLPDEAVVDGYGGGGVYPMRPGLRGGGSNR